MYCEKCKVHGHLEGKDCTYATHLAGLNNRNQMEYEDHDEVPEDFNAHDTQENQNREEQNGGEGENGEDHGNGEKHGNSEAHSGQKKVVQTETLSDSSTSSSSEDDELSKEEDELPAASKDKSSYKRKEMEKSSTSFQTSSFAENQSPNESKTLDDMANEIEKHVEGITTSNGVPNNNNNNKKPKQDSQESD